MKIFGTGWVLRDRISLHKERSCLAGLFRASRVPSRKGKDHNPRGITLLAVPVSSVFPLLHESLQQVLTQRLDWEELRDVQEQTYRAIHAGSDTLVIAPTAGGKSEAALIPVMDAILKRGLPGVTCIYLSPLKALINDQEERFPVVLCTDVSFGYEMAW